MTKIVKIAVLASILCVLVLIALAYGFVTSPYKKHTFSSGFTANDRLFAYAVREKSGWYTNIFDQQSGTVFRPSSPPGEFISNVQPHPFEPNRYFMSSGRGSFDDPDTAFRVSNVWDCSMETRYCRHLFTSDGAISSLWPKDGVLYFVRSPLRVVDSMPRGKGTRIVFADKDIYRFDPSNGEIEQVTHFGVNVLQALNISGDLAAFQSYGTTDGGLDVRMRGSRSSSEIFIVSYPFDVDEIIEQFDRPAIEIGKDIDLSPSLSQYSDRIALLTVSERGSFGYRYDIAIVDLAGTELMRIIEPTDGQLSTGVFVDDDRHVAFRVHRAGGEEIRIADTGANGDIAVEDTGLLVSIDEVESVEFSYELKT